MRLPNGYGSVHKLPGKRRRPWRARVTTGWTEDKRQEYYTVGYYETRAEAMDALAEYGKNPIGEARDKTFGEIYEKWSKSKYPKLDRSTVNGYKAGWKRLQALEDAPIRYVKKSHLQEIIDKMDAEGLSRSTLEKTKTLAVILFSWAIGDEIVKTNHGSAVELPAVEKKEKETFSEPEARKIAKHGEAGDIWAGTVSILIYTGMRISEMLELTKFSVDREEWTIRGGLKTEAGRNRIVPIHPKIMPFIQYWLTQPGDRLITRDGRPISANYYRRYLYYPTLERLDVRRLNPHCTRHTFLTMLDKAKVTKKVQQELAGHASYKTTAEYTHPDIEVLREGIKAIP